MTRAPITPPATIGMLGGGQLGKYAVLAANTMGYRTMVLDPDPHAPAGVVADVHLVAPYDDSDALDRLATECAVVTTEFENPPADALVRLAERTQVRPSPANVAVAQDRIREKAFLVDHGIAVGPHVPVPAGDRAARDLAVLTCPGRSVVKTARMGYDGKGQRRVDGVVELRDALDEMGDVDCIVETMLDLRAELSVVIARREDATTATYPVTKNVHAEGILDISTAPSGQLAAIDASARSIAAAVADALDYVGVLAVEMFVVSAADGGGDGEVDVLVNEIAPRPHNSGHWTLDASVTSQFEQQIRAVCGLGLGDTSMTTPTAVMVNLLGDVWFPGDDERPSEPRWEVAFAEPSASLHLYGKAVPRRGRKMGHLTVTGYDPAAIAARGLALRDALNDGRASRRRSPSRASRPPSRSSRRGRASG